MKKLLVLLLTSALALCGAEKIYVLNALGDQGTISKVENGVIANNIANTGKYPNDIKYSNGKLFVLNSGTNNIKIINEADLSDVGSCELKAAGSNPWKMAICNGKLYVTSFYSTGVEVWTVGGTYLKTIIIPDLNPSSGTGAIMAVGNKVFVNRNNWSYDASYNPSYGTEKMFVLNAETDEIVTSFTSGVNVAAMLIDKNNKLHVLCSGNRTNVNGYVKTYNAETYAKIDSIYLGSQPGAFCLGSESEVLVTVSGMNPDYSGFGGLMRYNATTNQVLNGASNLLYSSPTSGIMDICRDASGKVYLPLFNGNSLLSMDGGTAGTSWTTGNGPQNVIYVSTTGIEEEVAAKNLTLINAYPNPFNNSTKINFSLATATNIRAAVYNQSGQLVQELVRGAFASGAHNLSFNANGLNSGVYFLKISSDKQQLACQKLLLVK